MTPILLPPIGEASATRQEMADGTRRMRKAGAKFFRPEIVRHPTNTQQVRGRFKFKSEMDAAIGNFYWWST